MRVTQIKPQDIADYGRITSVDESTLNELEIYRKAAIEYVKSYTGLKLMELNSHEDISIAVLALAVDMYDNRSMYVDKSNLNKVVSSILDMYSVNLL